MRIGTSDLDSEKKHLEFLNAATTVPVPQPCKHYKSAEFEHLVMERVPGTTLETAWPTLSTAERESIADQVVAFISELRNLQSPVIQAALLNRKPFQPGLKNAIDLNRERLKASASNLRIAAYIRDKSAALDGQTNVFTHGDLDWSNIMIADKQVSGIIDWELSGYFPPYWEWIQVKRFAGRLPNETWFGLLELRLGKLKVPEWDEMWEVERLFSAINLYCSWAMMPEDREENKNKGWERVSQILGSDAGIPPPIEYAQSFTHPWWIERVKEEKEVE